MEEKKAKESQENFKGIEGDDKGVEGREQKKFL